MAALPRAEDETKSARLMAKMGWDFDVDLQKHLFDNIPGLYQRGMDLRSVHKLLVPPKKGTRAAATYHSLVTARLGKRRNDYRPSTLGTQYARSEQNMIAEFFSWHGQLNLSGDDMNIIQVGRPAVSRYHQMRGFFRDGDGANYAVHDFPNSLYGLKLGGFMVRTTGKKWKSTFRSHTWDY